MNKNILKTLGPGILFASTAIGVSHLVQSTRAGANYGFALVWAIVLSNLFKYPFFEYASRYANVTKTSIIDGYKKIGNWMLWLYFIITLGTMFFVTSAVGVVTSGFMDNLFSITATFEAQGFEHANLITPVLVYVVCIGVLAAGKFKLLDSLIKVIGAVLLISTLFAFFLSLYKGPSPIAPDFAAPDWTDFNIDNGVHLGFIIALMGWMPTALDLSSWNSLWTIARIKQSGYHPTLKESLFDFNFGYLASALLAICFVTLGAYLMYGTGESLSPNSAVFANQVVEMYTNAIGGWSYWIIAPSAFSIMFGTAIAVFDGYARTMERILEILIHEKSGKYDLETRKKEYTGSLIVTGVISFTILFFFVYNKNTASANGFKTLVDFATTTSFVVAPIIAVANFSLVQKKHVGELGYPPLWKRIVSYLGIIFLTFFALLFLFK